MVALFGKPLKVNYMANIEKNIDTSGIITLDYGNFKAVLIGAKDAKHLLQQVFKEIKGVLVFKHQQMF